MIDLKHQDKPGHSFEAFGSHAKYWTYGDPKLPTIIVIHGFRGTHHGLLSIIKYLPKYHVVVPDLPGFGDSTPMTTQPHNMLGYARFIRELIHHLKLDPVILLGHSMGTTVAAELVALDPAIATHLILINPIAEHPLKSQTGPQIALGGLHLKIGAQWLPEKIGLVWLSHSWPIMLASATMTKTRDKQLRRWIHANHLTYMKRFHNRHTLFEVYRASVEHTVTAHAANITIPTLLIAGRVDAIAPIKGQRKLAAAIAGAQLIEFDNVGHIIHYEKAREAAAAINDFLPPPATPAV
ncbi:MAG TPA: alpha/beta hydrolase [Candidatus Saccharimonadia bacterium]|nr:alpha/beta hydrolase [Candidatus Saccharimonadia bacterium]